MGLRRKAGGCLLAAAVLTGVALATPAGAAPPHTGAPGQVPHGASARTVTLITGDRVTVAGGNTNHITIQRGAGREHIRFITRTIRGHLNVIPSDAVPLLHAGRLDSRLFDVTTLLAFGYDDRRGNLPLIVTYPGGASGAAKASARASVSTAGTRVVRELPGIGALAVQERRTEAGTFWKSVTANQATAARTLKAAAPKIWLDGIRQPTLDVSVPLIGAPAAWQAGFTGEGVQVAVLDTGIDASHPDLAGKVVAEHNFTEGTEDDLDHVGHGTHVASTITGSGAASNGRYKGVAPGVKLHDGKVCVEFGCAESWILAGMEWAAAQEHAKVVNMSLGGQDTPDVDPLEQAVETLTAQYGTLFVIAAGNAGQDGSVASPGSADSALTVGATTKTDELAFFSSRGPRVGDSALKPDITAPGLDITAARSKDGFIGTPGELYATISGTSMATPHVVGSAAIMAQRHPDWSPQQLKAALMASAKPNPAIGVYAQGAGRVDIARGINQSISTSPASVSFGRQLWPHDDDTPVTRTVTYHNYGASDVTLDLALHTNGPDGKPSVAGLFTVSASRLTVPAGQDASVTVTAETRAGGPDGLAGGNLTATAGDQVVQTPLAIEKEVESYDLTIAVTDRQGNPTPQYDLLAFRLDGFGFFTPYDPDGTVSTRLPKGRYLILVVQFGGDETHRELTELVQPNLELNQAQTVAMDARLGKPISMTVQRPSAVPALVDVGFTIQGPELGFGADIISDRFEGLFSAQVGSQQPVDGLVSQVASQWGERNADGQLLNSPFAYNLAFFEKGRMITGFQRQVVDRELATVRSSIAVHATGAQGVRLAFGSLPDFPTGGVSAGFVYDLPATRTELYNTDNGVVWQGALLELVQGPEFPEVISDAEGPAVAYRAGRPATETWNKGVFGPSFQDPPFPDLWVTRTGDQMIAVVPLYGDSAGRAGFSMVDKARTTLFRDGTKVGETTDAGFGLFTVPAGQARYRLETEADRGAPFRLTTHISCAWTFRSAHVDGTDPVALPLSAIRFTPRLDDHNTAPAGQLFVLPISVERQPGSSAGRNKDLKVEVSFDDGTTWRKVPVLGIPGGGLVLLQHPKEAGFVSLRAKAVDAKGNTAELTIIRAYQIAPRS
jgi:subtilisin family serine protease